MIRLTIQAASTQETRLFDQSTILIGSSRQPEVDVCIDHPAIQPIHIKITKHNDSFIVVNVVNDPFAAVNGSPFGKKKLSSGDRIELNNLTILFEETEDLRAAPTEPLQSSVVLDRLEQKIGPLPYSTQDGETADEWEDWNLEELSHSIGFQLRPETPTPPAASLPPERTSLKDSHISETGEEKETWYPESNVPQKDEAVITDSYFRRWLIISLVFFLAVIGAWGTVQYINSSKKAAEEEMAATQGVADIAMALTHAQIHHIHPHNHNWTDSEFLQNHLTAVISDPHRLIASGDIQQYFAKHSYSLRVYTSSDMSQFVLIAQPMSIVWNNLWHSLISQSTILVDSLSMEIHKTYDLRTLNRLLAKAGPLEKENMNEIALLIKHEEIVPLAILSKGSAKNDFLPPRSLGKTFPGAENHIYNAPRYHLMGKPLIESVEKLHHNQGDIADVEFVKQEAKALAQLPNLVLYASQNKNNADLVQQGLAAFSPETSSLHIGWFTFDKQGDVSCCELLNHTQKWPAALKTDRPVNSLIKSHLHDRLGALKRAREAALSPLSKQLIRLIQAEAAQPLANFGDQYYLISCEFTENCEKYNDLLRQSIEQLYREFQGTVSLLEFMAIVKGVGIEDFLLPTHLATAAVVDNTQSTKRPSSTPADRTRFTTLLNRKWPIK